MSVGSGNAVNDSTWGIRHPSGRIERCPTRRAAEFAALFLLEHAAPEVVFEHRGEWRPARSNNNPDPMRPAIDRALDGDHRLCGIDPCTDCR